MKKHIFRIIQIGSKEDLPSRLFDFFIVTCIFANITIAFLYTYSELEPFKGVLSVLEAFTVMVFIVEYMLRLWTADQLYPEYPPGKARLKFLTSFDGVIDKKEKDRFVFTWNRIHDTFIGRQVRLYFQG